MMILNVRKKLLPFIFKISSTNIPSKFCSKKINTFVEDKLWLSSRGMKNNLSRAINIEVYKGFLFVSIPYFTFKYFLCSYILKSWKPWIRSMCYFNFFPFTILHRDWLLHFICFNRWKNVINFECKLILYIYKNYWELYGSMEPRFFLRKSIKSAKDKFLAIINLILNTL